MKNMLEGRLDNNIYSSYIFQAFRYDYKQIKYGYKHKYSYNLESKLTKKL